MFYCPCRVSRLTFGASNVVLWMAYFSALNALAHVVMVFVFGCKYNPGFVVSAVLDIPFGIYTVWYFLSNNLVSTEVNISGIVFGVIAQASM